MADTVHKDIDGYQLALFRLKDGKREPINSVFLTEADEKTLENAAKMLNKAMV